MLFTRGSVRCAVKDTHFSLIRPGISGIASHRIGWLEERPRLMPSPAQPNPIPRTIRIHISAPLPLPLPLPYIIRHLHPHIIGVVSSGVDLNDPSRSGNYTVTFVPLISVIANYLPIFLRRLRTQEIVSARSMNWLLTDHEICSPDHLGCFPNPDNRCQYFECAMNYKNLFDCSQHNRTNEYGSSLKSNNNIDDVIQLKSKIEPRQKKHLTSLAVVYKVNECVSLILHQCSPGHVYSNRLQRCVLYKDVRCPD
ncbi:hypothetical protein V9T40_010552 [Parthenolecanium corni]|uniref:Uncharacterized protein n=1 Tax=Parthenolecanium corni TaxID=536013 RepID=A0AAN9TI78_9HEMI